MNELSAMDDTNRNVINESLLDELPSTNNKVLNNSMLQSPFN